MAIDPAVLLKQCRALGVAPAPKPTLRLVHNRIPYAPSCECGTCRRCKKRQWMRDFRAGKPKGPPKPRGPSMALGRKCSACKDPIADTNKSGICCKCQSGWRLLNAKLREGRVAIRQQHYSHGGGI